MTVDFRDAVFFAGVVLAAIGWAFVSIAAVPIWVGSVLVYVTVNRAGS